MFRNIICQVTKECNFCIFDYVNGSHRKNWDEHSSPKILHFWTSLSKYMVPSNQQSLRHKGDASEKILAILDGTRYQWDKTYIIICLYEYSIEDPLCTMVDH